MPREFLERCCSSARRASVKDKSCSPAACLAATTRRITSVFLLHGMSKTSLLQTDKAQEQHKQFRGLRC